MKFAMRTTGHIKHYLLAAMIFAAQTVAWGQVTIIYDNPTSAEGQTSNNGSTASINAGASAIIPAGAINFSAQAWGGGGGGGGTSGGISAGRAGGGGGGAYVFKNFDIGGHIATIIVGRGGPRGESNQNSGATGGTSSIAYNGVTPTANGGNGGNAAPSAGGAGNGGSGGSHSNGDSGNNGIAGGTGGGATGPSGAGGNAGNAPPGGNGGQAVPGGSSSQGYSGYNPGGGGGGGRGQTLTSNPGGHGGGGKVILSYTIDNLTISGNGAFCPGDPMTLTASYETSSGVTFQWYKDNVAISGATGQTYTIASMQASDAGVYTVAATYNITYSFATPSDKSTLTVTGVNLPTGLSISGASPSFTLSGTVTATPVNVVVNAVPVVANCAVTICSGDVINNFAPPASSSTVLADNYAWTLASVFPLGAVTPPVSGSGSLISLGSLTNSTYQSATVIYNVIPFSAQGCQGSGFTFSITVNTPPAIDIITFLQTTYCADETLIIPSVTVNSNLPINSQGWLLGSDIITIPHILTATDNGKILKYFATNNCGTNYSNDAFITVNIPPTVGNVILSQTTYCEGDNPVFPSPPSVTSTPSAISQGWMLGSDEISSSYMFTAADNGKDLKYFAINACGISYSNVTNITVNTPPTIDNITTTDTYCDGEDLIFPSTPNFTSTTTVTDQGWILGNDTITSFPLTLTAADDGKSLFYFADNTCGSGHSNGIPITVNTPPVIGNIPSMTTTYCTGETLDFPALLPAVTTGISIIEQGWTLDGMHISSSYQLTASDDGATLQYYATNSCGTGFSVGIIITVNTPPTVGVNTFTKTTYCVGTNLIFPVDSPAIVASPAAIDSGWMLGADVITEPYILDVADNGKPLFFYATNTCGTSYSDSLIIKVIVTEIISITPNYGPTSSGTYDPSGLVKITGAGFSPFGAFAVSSVTFDGVSATIDYIHSIDDTVYCIPPPRANSGYVLVSVTAGCGTATLPSGYHYDAMNITGVSPDYGPVTGGTAITISGTGFLAGGSGDPNFVTVKIGDETATVVSVSDIEITCTTGQSNQSLLGSIEIFNSIETNIFADRFTYYPVTFVVNGSWSEPYNWETQTDDRILPYPDAVIHIKANCLQDRNLNGSAFPYNGAMDSITVYSNAAYTIGNGITLDANVFTLKDSASFLNFGTMQATHQKVERSLVQKRNWYVSSPLVTTQSIDSVFGRGANGSKLTSLGTINLSSELAASDWRVEWYKEDDHKWQRLPLLTSTLTSGLGYTVYSEHEDIAVQFSGTYHDGNIPSPALTRQPDSHVKRGFNLVGNPFPSYWRWTDAAVSEVNANVYSTIWYRTVIAGNYEFWSYNAAGNVGVAPGWNDGTPTGAYSLSYIPPLQAFWVRLKDGASSGFITFDNDRRSHADHASNVLRSAEITDSGERRMLHIALNGEKNTDETLIYTDSKAQYGFDDYDSDKMFSGMGAEIFTFPADQNRELVINGLPDISDGMVIPIGFQTDEGGNFSIHAKEMMNFGSFDVYLCDSWHNLEHRLGAAESPYRFTAGSEYSTDRFSVVFRSTGTNNDAINNGDGYLRAYPDKEGNIVVLYSGQDDCMVTVFNMLGNCMAVQNVVSNTPTVIKGKFEKGVYVLRAGKYIAKVAVQ